MILFILLGFLSDNSFADTPSQTSVQTNNLAPAMDTLMTGVKESVTQKLSFLVEVKETYDDNVFNESASEKEEDYITSINPKISYQFTPKSLDNMITVFLGASLKMEYYKNHPKLGENSILPKIYLGVNESLNDRFDVYLSLERKQEDIGILDPTARGEEKKRKNNFWTGNIGGSLRLGPKENTLKLSYSHGEQIYDGSYNDDNRSTESISITAYFGDPAGKRGFLQYAPTITRYPNNGSRDRVGHDIWLGLEGKFSPKISGTAKAGYGYMTQKQMKSYGTFIAELSLNYRMTKCLTFSMGFKRDLDMEGKYQYETQGTSVPDILPDDNAYITEDLKYIDSAYITYRYNPSALRKFSLGGGAYWSNKEYEGNDLDEVTYGFNCAPRYSLNKWSSVGVGYSYQRRMSTKGVDGYIDNKFTVDLTLEF